MGPIDLNLLGVFVQVAECESFSKAAKLLGLPKSSVSRSISSLEETMGVRLLHRTTRRVSLSTAGTALYERVAPQLAALRATLGDLPEAEDEPSGTLRISASLDFGAAVLAPVVARFTARHPAVEVDLRLDNAFVDVVAGGFDLALRITQKRLRDSSLRAVKLASLDIQIFAAPDYLARRGTPRVPDDLGSHDWVMLRDMPPPCIEGPSGRVTLQPRGRIVCDDMVFARQAVREGAGIAALPRFLAGADAISGRLVRVLPKWRMKGGDVWFVTPGGQKRVPRKVAAFRELLEEALAALPA